MTKLGNNNNMLIGAIAMSEPGAGSDLQSIRTKAVRDGDDYVINGAKTWISNGYNAGLVCVVCKTDSNARAKGMSIIIVETEGLEGFTTGKIIEKIGQKGQDTGAMVTLPSILFLNITSMRGFSAFTAARMKL